MSQAHYRLALGKIIKKNRIHVNNSIIKIRLNTGENTGRLARFTTTWSSEKTRAYNLSKRSITTIITIITTNNNNKIMRRKRRSRRRKRRKIRRWWWWWCNDDDVWLQINSYRGDFHLNVTFRNTRLLCSRLVRHIKSKTICLL